MRGFVNRTVDLDRLDQVLAGDILEPLAVAVSVIVGTAGVGKTSLALHWAHRVRERFPDGQLYVNLRGYDPGLPVTADQVLDRFLRALAVAPNTIPVESDDKAALYRSLLADRRMLVVLDNAASVAQVRPLLPGTAGCLVIVTSRNSLSGLVARDGARRLTVDVLTEPEAAILLQTVTDSYRTEDSPDRLLELARLCARLPLALRIAAERAARRPRMPLEELIRDLRDESGLWDALSPGHDEEADAVRTAFAWSYRALPEDAARMFRLLGLHPGPEFSADAAAAITGTSADKVRQSLDILVGVHLLEQSGPNRYQFHDLLRIYATDQARAEETPEDRQAVLRRVLTWYLHTVDAVQALVNPFEPRVALDPPEANVMPLTFSGDGDAMLWYETERANLVSATRAAADSGLDRIAWQLPVVLRSIYMGVMPFEDWLTTTHIGLEAARRLGDRGAEAELLESLALAHFRANDLQPSVGYYEASLGIRRELGDDFGQALVLNGLGLLHLRRRDLRSAQSSYERSLAIMRERDDSYWVALLMANLSQVRFELTELSEATDLVRGALDIFRARDARSSEGNALRILSMIQRELGHPAEALRSIDRALAIAHEGKRRPGEAYWLIEFGTVQRALGQPAESLVSYQRSAVMQRQLGDRSREAQALDGTGEAYQELGRFDDAVDFHRRAVAMHRELNDSWQTAVSLDHLAMALQQADSVADAQTHWAEALTLIAGFDDPRASSMRARISANIEAC
ncbi:MAG TPA: tetratricopeptide repeat protein [Pseudonocardiaceae bacterium]|nr:tetratricopeptide repeat protein [Pseudonocardiaceae bacterium]